VIPLRWDELLGLDLGHLDGGRPGVTITAIRADSREVAPGELFVALNAGVDFVADARSRGAATLVPNDQVAALAALGALVRSKSGARVVAVVGSAGKTSTKDILGALCAPHARTIWAERSLNNEIGVPLTLVRLETDTKILVLEMGMRGVGQIAALCAIARPELVVVPHIGPEHLELLGTVERVVEANAEAIEALPAGGVAIVPAHLPELEPFLRRDDIDVRRFDPADVELEGGRGYFHLDGRAFELDLPFTQRHQAVNTLAALHAYAALGLPLDRAAEGAQQITLSPWRGEELPLPGGGFVINDAYNANPDSMRAALVHLAERAGSRRRVAILGEMAELGEASHRYHREIGALAVELGVEVIGVGDPARMASYGPLLASASDATAASDAARRYLEPGDAVLVKASRAVGLEGIAQEIANFAEAWSLS
jgi:UDP-N-acetylmuramoyl-tripeptide--D-alanyl-D-alanine ligase